MPSMPPMMPSMLDEMQLPAVPDVLLQSIGDIDGGGTAAAQDPGAPRAMACGDSAARSPTSLVRSESPLLHCPDMSFDVPSASPIPTLDHVYSDIPSYMDMLAKLEPVAERNIATLFSKEDLRSSPGKWKQIRTRASGLTERQVKDLAELRRKELACVYAERARQRKAESKMQSDKLNVRLLTENASLQTEVKSLRQQVRELQALVATTQAGRP